MDTNLYEKRNRVDYFQMNTFTKGMNTDTSDAYMPTDQYRYAENLRVTSDNNGVFGELHLIEGTKSLEQSINGIVLDINYIKDICTIIYVNPQYIDRTDNQIKPAWYIDVYDYTNTTSPMTNVAGPFTTPIWNTDVDFSKPPIKKILSTTIIWEADDNIKLYIADGINPLMTLRLQKKNGVFQRIIGDYNDLFGSQNILLPPPIVEISQQTGRIEAPRVQYAYIVYEKYGTSTSLSSLSKPLSLYKDNLTGFYKEETTKAVNITIPTINSTSFDYIKIYRISYEDSSQQPKISIISDRKIGGISTFTDTGSEISTESVSEFLANLNLSIRPKLIEQKNNYLFAANVTYTQDEIDKQFEDFDSRCFSLGDYLDENTYFNGENLDDFVAESNIGNIHNKQFDSYSTYEQDPQWWGIIGNTGFNGIGKYFKWKYSVENVDITSDTQTSNSTEPKNSYLRNEVYRFGVKLYDLKGRASSVKWIADIKMPDFYNPSQSNTELNTLFTVDDNVFQSHILSIEFQPNNINDQIWDNISAYEIVQSPRTRDDIYGLTQGVGGYPIKIDNDKISLPYYLTTDRFQTILAGSRYLEYSSSGGMSANNRFTYNGHNYDQSTDYLLFASPETAYNQDDTFSIIDSGQWYIKNIFDFKYQSYEHDLTGNWAEITPWAISFGNGSILSPDNGDLTYTESDINDLPAERNTTPSRDSDIKAISDDRLKKFRIGVVKDNSDKVSLVGGQKVGGYYLDMITMSGGQKQDAYSKDAFEWKGYYSSMSYMSPISIVTSSGEHCLIDYKQKIESQDPDTFSNENSVTARSKGSTTISGGVTYYNWTNPAIVTWAFDVNAEDYLTNAPDDIHTPPFAWYNVLDGRKGWAKAFRMPVSAGGRYLLLKPHTQEILSRNPQSEFGSEAFSNIGMPKTPVFQIYKTTTTPYGGRNESAILNSTYLPIGAFAFKGNNCIAKGGDGYIKYFTFNHLSTQYNAIRPQTFSLRVLYQIPLESHIDIQGQASPYLYNMDYRVRDIAGTTNEFAQDKSLYIYSTSYNILPDAVSFYPNDELKKETQYTTRVHYSQPKTNNEAIDSWSKFKTIDFIDVDTRYGDITGLKLFKDKLVFMQDSAAGVLSVNDRTIINDSNNNSIILGNGGALQRYDYITTLYGMKPDQKAYTVSNDALYWWDGYNKEIIQYKEGYAINQLQHQKYIDSYIQNHNETKIPTVFYDRRNKETIFSVVNNESVVYNEKIEQFTSIYTFSPIYYCGLINCQIVTDGNILYEYNVVNETTPNIKIANLFVNNANPKLKYVVNKEAMYNKTFDIQTLGGTFYGEGYDDDRSIPYTGEETLSIGDRHARNNDSLKHLNFTYKTPLKQESRANGKDIITNAEYDFRLAIPRAGYQTVTIENEGLENEQRVYHWNTSNYGDRMRGKTMQCELESSSNNLDFSLQYIITKFRTSWT